MDIVNIILIVFAGLIAIMAMWWAFSAVRQIQLQKEYVAAPLTSIAKLWRRAKYVPEDARDRESLYLYRDFLRKFEDLDCKYPVIVKNGNVRCMTRFEYDQISGQKHKRPFSFLIFLIALVYAAIAVVYNIFKGGNLVLGISLAAVNPVLQILLAIFVGRFNSDKNRYREQIFNALRDYSTEFLRITKPYIIIDAYPDKFNKESAARYTVIGDLTPEQIQETRDYIKHQRQADQEISAKMATTPHPEVQINDLPPVETTTDQTATAPTTTDTPTPNAVTPEASVNAMLDDLIGPTDEAVSQIIDKMLNDHLAAETDRINQILATRQQNRQVAAAEAAAAEAADAAIKAPAADDFSLDAIGQALDAEIAKRNRDRKKKL